MCRRALHGLLRRVIASAILLTGMTGSALSLSEPTASSVTQGAPLPAGGTKFDQESALRISQSAIGKTPANYTFLDRQGRPVRLSSYLGKPLLVSFIYTGCFQVCPTNTRSLNEAVQALQKTVGPGQFNVVSIGFNQPFDSPQALRAFAAQHVIGADNWEFLSPHASIVAPLTRDFGFSYASTAAGIDHVLEVTILDAQGRIYTQVYGDRLSPEKLGEPVRQLLRGAPLPQTLRLADVLDRVRILCTVYDPVTGGYRYDYGLFLEIAGGSTFFLAMIWFFVSEWLARRRSRGQLQKASHPTARAPL